jgi:hypothetical protein
MLTATREPRSPSASKSGGRPDAITALDIYYYDEDEVDGLLPELATIRPFGNKSDEDCVDEPAANS